jgi:8-oxo-dGTP pyrophosphatase MutT (NUDIX family)
MDVGEHVRKAFAYAVRRSRRGCDLLAFRSLDEPAGFEVPKGALERGETFEAAARRELFEESGLDAAVAFELGSTLWENEEQRFFLFWLPDDVPDRFCHPVTGGDGDAGSRYDFEFLHVDAQLAARLVQGSGQFAGLLLRHLAREASRDA